MKGQTLTELLGNASPDESGKIQLTHCLQVDKGRFFEADYPTYETNGYILIRKEVTVIDNKRLDLIVSVYKKGEVGNVFLGHWNGGKS